MEKKVIRTEEIRYETDRRTARRLKKTLVKVLARDKGSDAIRFSYTYKPLKKRVDLLFEGSEALIKKCIRSFLRFKKRTERAKEKKEAKKNKLVPMKKGRYYTMKSMEERI